MILVVIFTTLYFMRTPWDYRCVPDYRGVRISQASGIFLVGVAMHFLLLSANTLARKADQRLELCEPMLLSINLLCC